ncbi:MAG TPA: hypothetical protein VGK31_02200 [Thermoanaerobaculia bacterium]|jgi:uncharacterized coiled-coil DUF342 family protein
MRVRTLLTATAFVSAILGAGTVYLVLTVPNDLKADSMLKIARKDLETGKRDAAREALSKIVQQYPRTDAAAAATVALVKLGEQQRKELEAEINRLRNENAEHTQTLNNLQQTVDEIKNAPPKVIVQQVAPPPKHKATPKKKAPTHRRRRR